MITRHERINLWISGIAVAISLLSPLMTYYLLDPTLQELKHRQPLLADLYGAEGDSLWRVGMRNPNEAPAEEVKLVATRNCKGDSTQFAALTARLFPATRPRMPVSHSTGTHFIETDLGSPLAAGDSLTISYHQRATAGGTTCWVEAGEIQVYSNAGIGVRRDHTSRTPRPPSPSFGCTTCPGPSNPPNPPPPSDLPNPPPPASPPP